MPVNPNPGSPMSKNVQWKLLKALSECIFDQPEKKKVPDSATISKMPAIRLQRGNSLKPLSTLRIAQAPMCC